MSKEKKFKTENSIFVRKKTVDLQIMLINYL